MERVALELQRTAIKRRDQVDDFDKFGRSAFNRYYYAVFLTVRDLILEFNPRWAGSHSSVPDMLRGSVRAEIAKFRSAANKRGNSDQSEAANKAIAAIHSLATLMEEANRLRVTADYNPTIKVEDQGGERFALVSTNITDAHQWPAKAKLYVELIQRALRLARGTI
jgi:uncharacterized protein (UPF0332 family)